MSKKYDASSREEMRAFLESPEYKRAVAETQTRMDRDNAISELAPWFGTTGLPDETERELSRYLRREFGEFLGEPNALKAADLTYLGAFTEQEGIVHYWQVPYHGEPAFAYVIVAGPDSHTGWGNRKPPPN